MLIIHIFISGDTIRISVVFWHMPFDAVSDVQFYHCCLLLLFVIIWKDYTLHLSVGYLRASCPGLPQG